MPSLLYNFLLLFFILLHATIFLLLCFCIFLKLHVTTIYNYYMLLYSCFTSYITTFSYIHYYIYYSLHFLQIFFVYLYINRLIYTHTFTHTNACIYTHIYIHSHRNIRTCYNYSIFWWYNITWLFQQNLFFFRFWLVQAYQKSCHAFF